MLLKELQELKKGTVLLGFEDFGPELTLHREITPSITGWKLKRHIQKIKVDFITEEVIHKIIDDYDEPYIEHEIGLNTYEYGKPLGIFLDYKFKFGRNVNRIFIKLLSDNKVGWLSGMILDEKVYIY